MTVAVFMSNFGFAAVIFLLLLAVIFLVNSFQKKTLNVLSRLSASYNDIETLLVRYTNSIDLMNTMTRRGISFRIRHIFREFNCTADQLANRALDEQGLLRSNWMA